MHFLISSSYCIGLRNLFLGILSNIIVLVNLVQPFYHAVSPWPNFSPVYRKTKDFNSDLLLSLLKCRSAIQLSVTPHAVGKIGITLTRLPSSDTAFFFKR